jgi:hypothetical protein
MALLTVGSGGDYATWQALVQALSATGISEDTTVQQISDTNETGFYSAGITLNGYTLIFESDTPHGGDPTKGHTINVSGATNSVGVSCRGTGTGLFIVRHLKAVVSGSDLNMYGITLNESGPDFLVHDLLVDISGATGGLPAGIIQSSNNSGRSVFMFNCAVKAASIGYAFSIQNNYGADLRVENCTADGGAYGFAHSGAVSDYINNVAVNAATGGFNSNISTCYGYNNASDDPSAGDGNWSTAANNITGITPANEFASLSFASPSFAKLKAGGSLEAGGTAPTIVENTVGIRGNARPHNGSYSIGADEYAAPPNPTSVTPNEGKEAGGTSVSIAGTDFVSGATVTFGGVAASNVTFVDATEITCDTPAGVGTVDVVVTNPDAQTGTIVGGFTYNPAPVPTTVVPDTGEKGTSVSVYGTGFVSGASVKFGGIVAANVVVVDSTEITCDVPTGVGSVAVIVTNPDSQSGTLANGFTYTVPVKATVPGRLPNMGRSLLLNVDGGAGASEFADEYVPPYYKAVELPSGLLTVRRALFGSNPDIDGLNYSVWQYMRLLHSTEYADWITALDSRITYLTNKSALDAPFGATVDLNADALQFVGAPGLGGAEGRLRENWIITRVSNAIYRITNMRTRRTETHTVAVTDGITDFMPMTGHANFKVRVRTQLATVLKWTVQYLAKPTSAMDPVQRAVQASNIGAQAYNELFPSREPYKLFKQLWEQHSLFAYRMSGYLLALIYRTEEIRRAG